MKFMLMMHATRGKGDWEVSNWPPQDLKAHIDFMIRFSKELTAAGELAGAEGLAAPGQAKIVRATKGGVPAVTDGPFPEAKEFLAGFWIVQVESAAAEHPDRGAGGAERSARVTHRPGRPRGGEGHAALVSRISRPIPCGLISHRPKRLFAAIRSS